MPDFTPTDRDNTRQKAIRLKCIDCCGGHFSEVRRCTHNHCPLWYYRFGVSENRAEETNPGCFDIEVVRTW